MTLLNNVRWLKFIISVHFYSSDLFYKHATSFSTGEYLQRDSRRVTLLELATEIKLHTLFIMKCSPVITQMERERMYVRVRARA